MLISISCVTSWAYTVALQPTWGYLNDLSASVLNSLEFWNHCMCVKKYEIPTTTPVLYQFSELISIFLMKIYIRNLRSNLTLENLRLKFRPVSVIQPQLGQKEETKPCIPKDSNETQRYSQVRVSSSFSYATALCSNRLTAGRECMGKKIFKYSMQKIRSKIQDTFFLRRDLNQNLNHIVIIYHITL